MVLSHQLTGQSEENNNQISWSGETVIKSRIEHPECYSYNLLNHRMVSSSKFHCKIYLGDGPPSQKHTSTSTKLF